MSDRRFVGVLVGLLVAVVGAVMVVGAIVGPQDPVHRDVETDGLTDLRRVLAALLALGAVLVLAGAGSAVGAVRAQLRRPRPEDPPA